jgi:hypothetical protein
MIKRGFFLCLMFLVFSMSLLSAAASNITLNTLPFHDVSISILRIGGDYDLVKNFQGVSDINGKFSAVFSSDELSSIDLKAYVKKNGNLVLSKKFGPFNLGSSITLDVYPDEYVKPEPVVPIADTTTNATNITNTTVVNTTKTIDEGVEIKATQDETKPSLTGLATSDDSTSSGKTLYYIIGGVVLLVLVLIIRFLISNKSSPKEIKVRKLSEIQRELKQARSATDFKKVAVKEEKEIVKLEKEVSKMKNQDRMKEIENRMRRDQEEMRRLRRGH